MFLRASILWYQAARVGNALPAAKTDGRRTSMQPMRYSALYSAWVGFHREVEGDQLQVLALRLSSRPYLCAEEVLRGRFADDRLELGEDLVRVDSRERHEVSHLGRWIRQLSAKEGQQPSGRTLLGALV